jgi:hypothetical protein
MNEPFDGQKFLHGFIDPAMLRKAIPLLFWIILILLFVFGSVLVGIKIKNYLFPKQAAPTTIENTSGGHIETQPDKRNKIGVINF